MQRGHREPHRPVHPELLGDRRDGGGDLAAGHREPGQLELDTLQEDSFLAVGVLIGVDDVAVALVDERGDRGDESGLVGTREEKGCGGSCHGGASLVTDRVVAVGKVRLSFVTAGHEYRRARPACVACGDGRRPAP